MEMDNQKISKGWLKVFGTLNEPQKRWFAAEKSMEIGYGGVSIVSRLTGLSRTTITQGRKEIASNKTLSGLENRLRQKGGGRKKMSSTDQKLITTINQILEEVMNHES